MNIKELIHDLRARINPQYYDQIGTESYERHQCVLAIEHLQQENERQRFDILAMNQSLDLMREENERLRKDAERYRWLRDYGDAGHFAGRMFVTRYIGSATIPAYHGGALDKAIDAARGEK